MLADKGSAVIVRVNSVRRIELRLGLSFECFRKEGVERDVRICELVSELADDRDYAVNLASPGFLCFVVEKEGAENNDLCVGLFLQTLKDRAVVGLDLQIGGCDVDRAVAMPNVIDADEDRNDVGLEGDTVGVESVEELRGTVSADSEIDELEIGLGERLFDVFCGELGITRAELVIISLISACVGYAVALKQDLH